MSKFKIFRRITLPRAVRICLPTMSTETILLLKATALASTVTVYEVLGTAQFIRQQSLPDLRDPDRRGHSSISCWSSS